MVSPEGSGDAVHACKTPQQNGQFIASRVLIGKATGAAGAFSMHLAIHSL